MTNSEMLDKIVASLGQPMGFSLSKRGRFLTIGSDKFDVTEEQACILWDLLPQVARHPLDGGARAFTSQPDTGETA